MSDANSEVPGGPASAPPPSATEPAAAPATPSWRVSLAEIDTRLFGMITAVIVI